MVVRLHYRILAALLALGVGALLLNARADDPVGPPAPDSGPFDDPFPIQRVLLPNHRLVAELDRVKQGVFVRLARNDFENRVRKAARSAGNRPEPPRIVEAHYRASLTRQGLDENSLSGTAEWKIVHNRSGPGLLPLDSMRIALRGARWTDNRPAVIGLLDPRTAAGLALLVEESGEHSLALDWSARGLPNLGELRFDLMVPASPIASLELELPADIKPILSQNDLMLGGPFPLDPEGKRNAWRIAFGGQTRLEIALGPAGSRSSPNSPMQVSLATRQDLAPGLLLGQYAFDFKMLRGGLSEFLLEHDAELTPTDVAIQNLESWQLLPGLVTGRKRIRVRLRDPARGGQLRVSATAPLPFNENVVWTSPTIDIVGAIYRGESLRLRLAPELKLIDWHPGTLRFAKSEFSPDRTQVLTLESTLLPEMRRSHVRPSARFRSSNTEFFVRQRTEWDVGADRSTLMTKFDLDVRRGKLNLLDIRYPAGWDVDRVETGTGGANPLWTTQAGPNPVLRVELPRSVMSGIESQIVVGFRQPGLALDRDFRRALPFPDAVPVGARSRQGEYAINVSPTFLATAPPSAEDAEVVGPQLPDFADGPLRWSYRFHGYAPTGPLFLTARMPRFSALSDSEVSLAAGEPFVSTRLILKPESGSLSSLFVFSTEPVTTPWMWRTIHGTNRVVAIQRLPIGEISIAVGSLGARTPLGVPLRLLDRPNGHWYRMNFARPLDGPLTIESTYGLGTSDSPMPDRRLVAAAILGARSPLTPIALGTYATSVANSGRQPLPLIRVLGATSFTGTVAINLDSGDSRIVEATGLARESSRGAGPRSREVYRLSDNANSLTLAAEPRYQNERAAQVDEAELTIVADPSGIRRCHYGFRLRGWNRGTLPIRLPNGAQPIEIAVAGQTISAERCRMEQTAENIHCSFPVSAGDSWQRIEILFSVPASHWWVSSRLTVPIVELPLVPPTIRTVWRLPPGVVPVSSDNWTLLPGGSTRVGHLNLPRISGWFDAETDNGTSFDPRSNSGKGLAPNAKTFVEAWLGSGSPIEKLIVDTAALAEAEVHSTTRVPIHPSGAPNWRSLGLTIVSFPQGTVLTTPRQRSIWRADAARNGALPPSIQVALTEARQSGRDASGRFRSIADREKSSIGDNSTLLPHLGGDGVGWTVWTARDAAERPSIQVANTACVTLAGWLIAAAFAAIGMLFLFEKSWRAGRRKPPENSPGLSAKSESEGLRHPARQEESGGLRRSARWRTLLLLVWLLAAGCALVWLPTALSGLAVGPMLSGMFLAVILACRRRPSSKERPTIVGRPSTKRRLPTLSATRALPILLVLSAVGRAAAPEPATVYLLPGPDSDPEPRVVLVSPDVLDRLALMAKPQAALNEAVVLRARYTGRAETSGNAEFDAHYDLTLFADRTVLDLPLGDVRLREALLDGAAAFPKPSGTERFAIEIKGRGEHRLDFKFSAAVTGTGPDRDVRFSTPEVAICELAFTTPKGAEHPQAANWNGAQNSSADGRELKADLGRTRSVHFRWRQAGMSTKPQVRVQETAVWDIAPAGATLYSVFDYRIAQGAVSSFKIALPPDLEVVRIEVRPESAALGAPESSIRDWRIGPNRVLSIDLQGPLTGSVRLLLEAIPAIPLTTRPALLYPAALDVAETESFAAFRLHGFELAADFQRRGVTEFSTESFLRDFWRPTGAEKIPAPLTRAYRRLKNDSVFLHPVLQISLPVSNASQELVWWLGPTVTDVRGTARWNSAAEPLTFVEWEVPPAVIVSDVRGLGIQSWSRAGNKIQVWLRDPAAEVLVVWYGSLPRGDAANESAAIELPSIRLEGAASQSLIQRLRAPMGWTLTPDNPATLGTPVPPQTNRELAFLSPSSSSRFHLRGPQADASFRILASAGAADRRMTVTAHIDPSLRSDRPHSFTIVVDDAEGWEMDLRLPAGCRGTSRTGTFKRREWIVDVSPRDRDDLDIVVAMDRPLDAPREISLPQIAIQRDGPPVSVRRQFLLLGPEIRAHQMIGLRQSHDPAETLALWARERERLAKHGGSIWESVGDEARANVLASPSPLESPRAVTPGLAPESVRILPKDPSSPLSAFASFGLIALAVALLGLLMIFGGQSTRPEQFVAIGALGVAAFGIPEGLVFLALSAIGILLRTIWVGRRASRWVARY